MPRKTRVRCRAQYDKDADRFCANAEAEQQELRDRLMAARGRLSQVWSFDVCTCVG